MKTQTVRPGSAERRTKPQLPRGPVVAPMPSRASFARGACACGGGCPRCQSAGVQTKLAVSQPGDPYEREADRIAQAIVSGSSAAPSRASAARTAQRKTRAGTTRAASGVSDGAARELGSGRPLDAASRSYFEPRLGHDLSSVELHTGAAAAQSAAALGARAYTMGRHVVFGAGEYAPGALSGRHLLAHELVHVVQQGAAVPSASSAPTEAKAPPKPTTLNPGAYSVSVRSEGGGEEVLLAPPIPEPSPPPNGETATAETPTPTATPGPITPAPEETADTVPVQRMVAPGGEPALWIQRASFTNPTPVAEDPLVRADKGLTPGLTSPKVNGSLNLLTAISPSKVAGAASGGKTTCQFDAFTIDTTADMVVASAAPKGGWSATVGFTHLPSPPECVKKKTVPAVMNATPSNADFVKRVQTSENEHAADLKWLHDRYLVPYETFVNGLRGSGADLPACGQDLVAKLGHRVSEAAWEFSQGWNASLKKLDGPQGTHRDNAVVRPATKDCASVTISMGQATPTVAGAGPGNVTTVAPTVTTFDPKKLAVDGSSLKEGAKVVKTFTSAADATTALATIKHYGMTSRNVIGSFEYFLVGTAAPSGALAGANELAIDPAGYQVTEGVTQAGEWVIVDAAASATGISANSIVNFGANMNEAFSAFAVMTSLGFSRQCWVGGTR
ncbi:MAG TPA: DUF4157 domain-containing protein, partial [Burkholderiales bacterium]|nr:DUF4157 domain-containing protein [Burkholderiales bacterium]